MRIYLHPSQMWLKDDFIAGGYEVIEIQPMPMPVCPACGEPVNNDGYCPTIQAKWEQARAEFDDEAAYQVAEEYDWWHRHPNADRWTQL